MTPNFNRTKRDRIDFFPTIWLRRRTLAHGLAWTFLSCLAAPCLAESAASETEKGTEMILDMILEEQPGKEAQSDAAAAARAADSLKITESEELIDPSTLSAEEKAQLEASLGVWVNHAAPAATPANPTEMVEPVQITESSEQVVEEDELTPELLAEFPEMQTAPLPAPVQPEPVAAPEPASQTASKSEESETSIADEEGSNAAPRQISMPRVTRWGGRPAPN